jgi:hypothetical protein
MRESTPDLWVKIGLSRAGATEEMKTLIKPPKYEKWSGYQQMFPLNIEGMYRHGELHRRPNP